MYVHVQMVSRTTVRNALKSNKADIARVLDFQLDQTFIHRDLINNAYKITT